MSLAAYQLKTNRLECRKCVLQNSFHTENPSPVTALFGISKFSQLSIFSELNNLQNISMRDEFSALCGITEHELFTQLKPDIERMAAANQETYEEACAHLKKQYDGYHFSENCEDLYNPFSLFNAFNSRKYDYFWFESGTPTFLLDILKQAEFNVRDLENKTEKHYQTIFYLLFRLMGQYVDAEVKSAVGRADMVVRLQDAVYVFEFKYDGTPEEALAQINSKQYAIPFNADGRKVYKIGINFDSSTRTIGDWKIAE